MIGGAVWEEVTQPAYAILWRGSVNIHAGTPIISGLYSPFPFKCANQQIMNYLAAAKPLYSRAYPIGTAFRFGDCVVQKVLFSHQLTFFLFGSVYEIEVAAFLDRK